MHALLLFGCVVAVLNNNIVTVVLICFLFYFYCYLLLLLVLLLLLSQCLVLTARVSCSPASLVAAAGRRADTARFAAIAPAAALHHVAVWPASIHPSQSVRD